MIMTLLKGNVLTRFMEKYGLYNVEITNDNDRMVISMDGDYDKLIIVLDEEESILKTRKENKWVDDLYKEAETAARLVSE